MAVLVVEEDRALARVWAEGLAERGYPAVAVTRMAEAMATVRTRTPEMLIGSLMVEGESLLPLIVAAQYRRADLATILLSDATAIAHADLFGMLGSLRCVLGKPVLPDDLIDIAEHHLRCLGLRPLGLPSAPPPRPPVCGRCALASVCGREGQANKNRRGLAAPADFVGAGDGIRTHDPNLGKVVLYP